jgi:hypothetical protein
MALVELTQCNGTLEAAVLQSALEAEGMPSFVFDAEMSWIGEGVRARVMVDEDDLARAKPVLAREIG